MTGNGGANDMKSPVGQGSPHGADLIRCRFKPVNAHNGDWAFIRENKGVRIRKIWDRFHRMPRELQFNPSHTYVFCNHSV